MAPLSHPNLVNMLGACWKDGPDKLCLVLEYVDGGTLRDVLTPGIKGVTWSVEGYGLAHGVAKCFRYLHHASAPCSLSPPPPPLLCIMRRRFSYGKLSSANAAMASLWPLGSEERHRTLCR